MTLSTGTKLSHYEITFQIGKGGMGEVYQAKDQKLGRDVAIKVLPEEFARNVDRVARFQREAKLLASLNHPNIAAIYGLEESDGTHFLVMELVEGDTLRDRIKTGPIPVEEALKLALQMAEALEAAHEKGVIHRDLKPANIKVTPDGKVKILDFGLAKAYVEDQENISQLDSPTISAAVTQQGVILGTAAYMSPEQAKGKSVNKRADIWSFGVVLFEMLTGRQLFTGETGSETLASVMKSEPEWVNLPPNLHPRIRFLLKRCLKKEPRNRYSGISDARVDIQEVLDDPSGIFAQPISAVEPRKKLRSALALIAATFILTTLIVGAVIWNLRPTVSRQVVRFSYELPEAMDFISVGGAPLLAVSPDSTQFVYCDKKGLSLCSFNELSARQFLTNDLPMMPEFSPDGKWIAYWSEGDEQLKKIAISGGTPIPLPDVIINSYLSWNEDNMIMYGYKDTIWRISANGGNPEPLLKIEGGIIVKAQMLPDGKSVIFTNLSGGIKTMVHSLKTGETKSLLEAASGRYVQTGHIIYCVDTILYAVPFDTDALEITGAPVSLVDDVMSISPHVHQYAVSDSGTLVYAPDLIKLSFPEGAELVWVDRAGIEEMLAIEPDHYRSVKISPDGKKIALTIRDGTNDDIWIWDIADEQLTRLTFHDGLDDLPLWTVDGKRIIFVSNRGETHGLYWKAVDGTGTAELLYSSKDEKLFPSSFSADGNVLILITSRSNQSGMAALFMNEDKEFKYLFQNESNLMYPKISPDGQWLAYVSVESSLQNDEIYVSPFPDVKSGKWQITRGGGLLPLWSPDGQELYYISTEREIMAVQVEADTTFHIGKREAILVDINLARFPSLVDTAFWDIHPDGKRILMIKPAEKKGVGSILTDFKINIVLNWFEELKQRVPVD